MKYVKFFSYLLGYCILALGLFNFSISFGLATEAIDQSQLNYSGTGTDAGGEYANIVCQTFIPEKGNISSASARIVCDKNINGYAIVVDDEMCANTWDDLSLVDWTKNLGTSTPVNIYTGLTTGDAYYVERNFVFSEPLEVIKGHTYSLCFITDGSISAGKHFDVDRATFGTDPYPNGYITNELWGDKDSSNTHTHGTCHNDSYLADIYFKTFYDEETEASQYNWYPATNYLTGYWTDFAFPEYQYCIVNEPCNLKVYYTEESLGISVYVRKNQRDSEGIWTFVEKQASSTTILSNTINFWSNIPLNIETTSTSTQYVFVYEAEEGDHFYTGTHVEWVEQWEIEEAYQDLCEDYDSSAVCDGISTSTDDNLWDDFSYGIECGLRKVGYWLMTPSYETCVQYQNHLQALRSNFPFSVITQIKNVITQESVATTTEYQSMPLLYIAPGDTEAQEIGDLLDNTQFQNGEAYNLFVQFYNLIEGISWAMLLAYILFRIIL